jgi:hypothetical protein
MELDNITEVSEQDYSGFDNAWDDESETVPDETLSETENQSVDAEETPAEPQNTEDTSDNSETSENTENTENAEGGAEEKDQFTLKHLDDVKTVGREEVITLAQKGMDYDRIRGKLNDVSEKLKTLEGISEKTAKFDDYEAFLKELASSSAMSIDDLIDNTRATMLSKREGIDRSVALQRVMLDKREKTLSAKEQQLNETNTAQSEEEQKRQADMVRFVKEYPDVKPTDIPSEVWSAVREGESLTAAYGNFALKKVQEENKKLQQRIDAMEQNEKNRGKAADSQQSAGSKNNRSDPFDEGWND